MNPEFLRIVKLTLPELAEHVRGKGGRFAMQFRRRIQQHIVNYVKGMPIGARGDDKVVGKAVAMTAKLEKWARMDFEASEIAKATAMCPNMSPKKIKQGVRAEWERIAARESY